MEKITSSITEQKYNVAIVAVDEKQTLPSNAESVRQALLILLQKNPQVFEGEKTPEEILQELGQNHNVPKIQESEEPTGRWAKVAERTKEIKMSREAAQIMAFARKEFREGFAFEHDRDET